MGFVSGQVRFPDGSGQSTAFDGQVVAPPGSSFYARTSTKIQYPNWIQLSNPVPTGQELIILLAYGEQNGGRLSSRVIGENPEYLPSVYNLSVQPIYYPPGTLVIDEGNELWIETYEDIAFDPTLRNQLTGVNIFGYYRDK